MEKIPIKMLDILNFLAAIEDLKRRSTVLKLLSETLLEIGIVSYRYDIFNTPLSSSSFKCITEPNDRTEKEGLATIFKSVSLGEIANAEFFEAPDLEGSFLVFPTFGPHMRIGIFILHSQALPASFTQDDKRKLGMALQKAHVVISVIEAHEAKDSFALTEREIDVLACASSGLNNREAADLLGISIHTINGYHRRIMLKLGTHDRLNMVLVGLSTPQVISRARSLII